MSVITPLLDTLLHEVLGKPRQFATPRDLNQPVDATHMSVPGRGAHSDSRLDARRPPLADLTPAAAAARRAAAEAFNAQSPDSTAPPPSEGVATNLSPAAQRIAQLLARLPTAPPLGSSAATPLLGNVLFAEPPRVAQVLQQIVDRSGLFFEARLARWHRGELAREALDEQPQMRLLRAGQGDEEALQNLVRQQLDLLAAPQLRWEGQPWPGFWLQFTIHAPHDVHEDESKSDQKKEEQEQTVLSTLSIEVQPLGRIDASMRLTPSQLMLDLRAERVQTLALLRAARQSLEQRLENAGLPAPIINLQLKEA